MHPSLTIPRLARAYGVLLYDAEDGEEAIIVSSGAGCMSAAMDSLRFRYCMDIDQLTPRSRLSDFLLWCERILLRVVVVGWFSLTDPEPLRQALSGIKGHASIIAYTPGTDLGCRHVANWIDFEMAVHASAQA